MNIVILLSEQLVPTYLRKNIEHLSFSKWRNRYYLVHFLWSPGKNNEIQNLHKMQETEFPLPPRCSLM